MCVLSWGRWFDECRESGDLSEHTWGEGVCGNGFVCGVFMMCGLDECEVMFCKLSGGWVQWLIWCSMCVGSISVCWLCILSTSTKLRILGSGFEH